MANVNLSASFLVLLAGGVIIVGQGGVVVKKGAGGKIINVGMKGHATVRGHAHPEKKQPKI